MHGLRWVTCAGVDQQTVPELMTYPLHTALSVPAGHIFPDNRDRFSVAGLPYYQLWVDSECGLRNQEAATPNCPEYVLAAGSSVLFPLVPAKADIEVQFKSLSGSTVLECSMRAQPSVTSKGKVASCF